MVGWGGTERAAEAKKIRHDHAGKITRAHVYCSPDAPHIYDGTEGGKCLLECDRRLDNQETKEEEEE